MPKRSRKPPQRDYQQVAGDILNQVVTNSGEVPTAVAKSAAVKSDDELRSDLRHNELSVECRLRWWGSHHRFSSRDCK